MGWEQSTDDIICGLCDDRNHNFVHRQHRLNNNNK